MKFDKIIGQSFLNPPFPKGELVLPLVKVALKRFILLPDQLFNVHVKGCLWGLFHISGLIF